VSGAAFLVIFVAFFLFVIIKNATTGQPAVYDRLAAKGLPGRALVLSSFQMAQGVSFGLRRFQRRQMTIEIEVAGMAPYQLTNTFLVPRGVVEPIPGASLDVAVDPKNPQNVAVLGPGGFTGPWIRLGPPPAF